MDSPADDDNSNFEKNDQQLFFHYWLKFFFADIDWIGRDDNCCWGTKKNAFEKRRTRGNFAADVTTQESCVKKNLHALIRVSMYVFNKYYL